ncbi:hypothetical protein [Xanthobacter sp. VNH20]|uniref:hypothetical protein n=1 Tax=Xanthobacter sp. VNH20 TaxID=3156616 RepID=UPI0032B3B45C
MKVRVRTLPRLPLPISYQAPNGSPRPLNSRLADSLSLEDFGAIGDGTSHPLSEKFSSLLAAQRVYESATSLDDEIDTVAIQKAFDSGRALHGSSKAYMLNKLVTATNKSFSLKGCGIDTTRFLVTSAAGGIKINITSQSEYGDPDVGGTSKYVTLVGFSMVAWMEGTEDCGEAINITYPEEDATVPGTICVTIEDVSVHGKNYWSDEENPHWAVGLKMVNVSGLNIHNFSYVAIGDDYSSAIWIDNDNGSNCFSFNFSGINIQGGLYGFRAHGWLEAIVWSDFTILCHKPFVVDASTASSGVALPLVVIQSGHLNGHQTIIQINKMKTLYVADVNAAFTYVEGMTPELAKAFDFNECNDIYFHDFHVNNGFGTAEELRFFSFVACWRVFVHDGTILCTRTDERVVRGVCITNGCQEVDIHDVTGTIEESEEHPLSMFFIQNGGTDPKHKIKIHHNTSRGWTNDVELYDPTQVEVTDNDFSGINGKVVISGTATQPLIVERNSPADDVMFLSGAGATPTIIGAPDGRVFLSDGSATNTTNFLGGRNKMQLVVATSGNRTFVHGTNLKLAGGTNYTPTLNASIAFIFDGTAWREIWRAA